MGCPPSPGSHIIRVDTLTRGFARRPARAWSLAKPAGAGGLRYRTLGNTELELSEVGFGLWTLASGGGPFVSEEEAVSLLVRAFDLGITFYDTADTYGDGYGESVLSRALRRQRHDIVIATKVGYDMYTKVLDPTPRPREQNFSPRYVRYACEQSLRRLNTDYIDLYQLHNPTMYQLEDDELFDTLDNLVREGKIRYYGFAPEPGVPWDEEAEAAMQERSGRALQLVYNMLEQRPARDLFPIAGETNTGLIAREPHARGALAAARTSQDATEEREGDLEHGAPMPGAGELGGLGFLTSNLDLTMGQLAVRFVLAEPLVASALPNVAAAEQLEEFAAASDGEDIPEEFLERLRELYDEGGLPDAHGPLSGAAA